MCSSDLIQINNENNSELANQDIIVNDVAIYCSSDNTCDVYVGVKYRNIDLIVWAKAQIQLNDDKTFTLTMETARLGTLDIPADWVLSKLQDTDAFASISDSISVSGNSIVVPASYSMNIMDTDFTIDITRFTLNDGTVTLQTTSAMDTIAQLLQQYLTTSLTY